MTSSRGDGPILPDYGPGSLGAVMPSIARLFGVDVGLPSFDLPAARSVCLVLVDGLGAELIDRLAAEHPGTAPLLERLTAEADRDGTPARLRAGVPSTTATSMGSLGTGLAPGGHGLLGYQVRDPRRGALLNLLRWDPYTDPVRWQPRQTVFQRLADAGVAVVRLGEPGFDGSGLTSAAHRGGVFVGTAGLPERVDATITACAGDGPRLAYLYWGGVDAVGHEHGVASAAWRAAVAEFDRALGRLLAGLPAGCLVLVTADHGMVDVPHATRLDVAAQPGLRSGVALLGGEPRLTQLYCVEGRAPAVRSRWQEAMGDRAWVVTAEEAIDAGWFGPVEPRVRGRIGDVLVAARGDFAVVDSALHRPRMLGLVGHHGSLTPAEQWVPLLSVLT